MTEDNGSIDQRIVWKATDVVDEHPIFAGTLAMAVAPILMAGLAWGIGAKDVAYALVGVSGGIVTTMGMAYVVALISPTLEARYGR